MTFRINGRLNEVRGRHRLVALLRGGCGEQGQGRREWRTLGHFQFGFGSGTAWIRTFPVLLRLVVDLVALRVVVPFRPSVRIVIGSRTTGPVLGGGGEQVTQPVEQTSQLAEAGFGLVDAAAGVARALLVDQRRKKPFVRIVERERLTLETGECQRLFARHLFLLGLGGRHGEAPRLVFVDRDPAYAAERLHLLAVVAGVYARDLDARPGVRRLHGRIRVRVRRVALLLGATTALRTRRQVQLLHWLLLRLGLLTVNLFVRLAPVDPFRRLLLFFLVAFLVGVERRRPEELLFLFGHAVGGL